MAREYRKEPRKSVGYPATLIVEGGILPCLLKDISKGGARVIVDDATRLPDRLTIRFAAMGARREGTVMWRGASEIGIRFDTPARNGVQNVADGSEKFVVE
jgi:PilZ domain